MDAGDFIMQFDKRLIPYLKKYYQSYVISLVFSLLTVVSNIVLIYLISQILSAVFIDNKNLLDLQSQILLIPGFSLLKFFSSKLGDYFNAKAASKIQFSIREKILNSLNVKYREGQLPFTPEKINIIIHNGVDALDGFLRLYVPQLFWSFFIPLFILIIVLPMDTLTFFVFLLTAPIIPLFMVLIGKTTRNLTQKQWQTLMHLGNYYIDVIKGIFTLKIFAQMNGEYTKIEKTADEFKERTMNVLKVAFLSSLVLELVASIATAVVAVEVGIRLLYGSIIFSKALFVLMLAPEFYSPLRNLGARFHAAMDGISAMDDIEILIASSSQKESTNSLTLPEIIDKIEFQNISFRYPGSQINQLNDISFTLHRGGLNLIMGPSGSGKTTLTRLILDLQKPQKEQRLINNAEFSAIKTGLWNQRIGYLSQTPYLFQGTVSENLRQASPQSGDDELFAVLEKVQLTSWLQQLPGGLDTEIGEEGRFMSGGERQRLALAQLLLRDPEVLIFDEPASSLDLKTHKFILDQITELSKKKFVVLIAHHLGAVQNAAYILYLKNGKIGENGTFKEILNLKGEFSSLWEAYKGRIAG